MEPTIAFIGGLGVGLFAGIVLYCSEVRRLRAPQEHVIAKIIDAFKVGLAVQLQDDTRISAGHIWQQVRGKQLGAPPPLSFGQHLTVPQPAQVPPQSAFFEGSMDTFGVNSPPTEAAFNFGEPT